MVSAPPAPGAPHAFDCCAIKAGFLLKCTALCLDTVEYPHLREVWYRPKTALSLLDFSHIRGVLRQGFTLNFLRLLAEGGPCHTRKLTSAKIKLHRGE